jgi:SAM-dependent methyltransferase
MQPKPLYLRSEYGAQFEDASVAAVYRKRPPYPDTLFDVLQALLPSPDCAVLDLGCGTGEIAIPMSRRARRVDALDPSPVMLEVAKSAPTPQSDNVRWINQSAETYLFPDRYGLVVAVASLHWMEWEVVLPKIRATLDRGGFLAIVENGAFINAPWMEELRKTISRFSTNREYRQVDLIKELCDRRIFRLVGQKTTPPEYFGQSIDDYVASFHARNGLSRERMARVAAEEFDSEVRRIVKPFATGGMLRTQVQATVFWGMPTI